ncbi:MAG: glycogen-binding domain-containing protein [Spirochaetales bacterium]|nr:glycogen-binding domain-containing protein [Spirochaetales bacterium]
MKNRVILLFLLFSAAFLHGFEVNDINLHLKITGITEASAPEVWRDYLILTSKPSHDARFVGAAFSTDNFQTVYSYQKNSHGVYFLVMPLPAAEIVDYRVVIDGIWIEDAENPDSVRDRNGLYLSRLTFSPEQRVRQFSPVIKSERGTVEFYIRTAPGKRVYLSGDFNRWDPYMTALREEEPGLYSTELSIKPGRYAYYFLIDGEPVPDPLNFQKNQNRTGEEVSILFIPG